MINRALLIALLGLLTGCAFGQKINYTGFSSFQIPEKTPKAVALAVSDKRPAVVAVNATGGHIGRASTAGVRDLSASYPLSTAVKDIFQELFNSPEVKLGLEGIDRVPG